MNNDLRSDDREGLSALFDGELEGDARLFALRRLGHDAEWQRRAGQWQMVGDVLRRQAPIMAPDAFAGRVSAALAAERVGQAAVPGRPGVAPVRGRARWIGGALAASLALAAAVSALRPGSTPEAPAAPVVATAAPATAAGTVASATPATEAHAVSSFPSVAKAADAPPAAASVASRRPVEARRAPGPRAPIDRDRAAVAASVAATGLIPPGTGNPFNLGTDTALTTRPWPRATLASGAAGFTARYGVGGESAEERPSFYPFEPRPQGEPEASESP